MAPVAEAEWDEPSTGWDESSSGGGMPTVTRPEAALATEPLNNVLDRALEIEPSSVSGRTAPEPEPVADIDASPEPTSKTPVAQDQVVEPNTFLDTTLREKTSPSPEAETAAPSSFASVESSEPAQSSEASAKSEAPQPTIEAKVAEKSTEESQKLLQKSSRANR